MANRMESLAEECLSVVSDLLSSFDIARLWLCGSKPLILKLLRAVRTFRHYPGPRRSYLFPSIISSFHNLHSLDIRAVGPGFNFMLFGIDISQISTSLRSLHLNFANGLIALLQHPLPLPNNPLLLRDLKSLFPNLASLTIHHNYSALFMPYNLTNFWSSISSLPLTQLHLPWMPAVEANVISNLPETLTDLQMVLKADTPCFSMPPLLRRLVLLEVCDLFPTSMLPRCMVDLELRFMIDANMDVDFWKNLPKHLEKLYISHSSLCASKNDIALLPSTLKVLVLAISYLKMDAMEILPPQLQQISFGSKTPLRYATIPHPDLLPRTLTSIPSEVLSDDCTKWKLLPRTLSSSVFIVTNRNASFLADIPPASQSINLIVIPEIIHLPNLTTINFCKRPELSPHFISCLQSLPSLTSLHQPTTIKDPSCLDNMTCQLKQLSINTKPKMINFSAPWAKKLEKLEIYGGFNGSEDNPRVIKFIPFLSSLPSCLTSLNLSTYNLKWNKDLLYPTNQLKWPSSLTELETNVDTPFWKYLPHSLLKFNTIVSCSVDHLLHMIYTLPIGLNSLKVSPGEIKQDERKLFCPFLASRPSLTYLRVYKFDVNLELKSVESLPHLLEDTLTLTGLMEKNEPKF
jgi:hypothetical protein